MNNFEELVMNADSLYLTLAETELEECIRPKVKAEWRKLKTLDIIDFHAKN